MKLIENQAVTSVYIGASQWLLPCLLHSLNKCYRKKCSCSYPTMSIKRVTPNSQYKEGTYNFDRYSTKIARIYMFSCVYIQFF